jgi:homoserine kinase
MKRVHVKVPATSANLGPGFDVLGVALPLYNDITMEINGGGWTTARRQVDISIDIEGEGFDVLPRDESNLLAKTAFEVFETARKWPGTLKIKAINRIPLARGLGSSAATILGAICAANKLCGSPLTDQQVLNMAAAREGHADNVVPAMVGGFCISMVLNQETHYVKFPAASSLQAVVCIPQKSLSTKEARRVLPSRVPLSAAVFTSSHVAFLLGALWKRNYPWLSFAMDDVLHQPARAALLPGLRDVIADAKKAGAYAYGAALSGAGSSVIAFVKRSVAKNVGDMMQKRFASRGVASRWLALPLENKGIRYS